MHPRDNLERKTRNELKKPDVNSFYPRDRLARKIRNNKERRQS